MSSLKTVASSIDLQKRDIALLRGLFECRIMNLSHISALHFDGKREYAKRRVRKLKRAGFIGERRRRVNEPSVLFLTRKAFSFLTNEGHLAVFPKLSATTFENRANVSSITIRHELEVMDVKTAFHAALAKSEKFTIKEFTTWPLLNQFEAARNGSISSSVVNLTNVSYPVSHGIVKQYDALNRLTTMVDAIGTTTYGYTSAGQLQSEDGPWSDDTVSYAYNNRRRSNLSVSAPNASAWAESYAYDSAGRLSSLSSPAGNSVLRLIINAGVVADVPAVEIVPYAVEGQKTTRILRLSVEAAAMKEALRLSDDDLLNSTQPIGIRCEWCIPKLS